MINKCIICIQIGSGLPNICQPSPNSRTKSIGFFQYGLPNSSGFLNSGFFGWVWVIRDFFSSPSRK